METSKDKTAAARSGPTLASLSVVLLYVWCAGVQHGSGEPIFHYRDRSDLYQNRGRARQTVSTQSDAQAFLIHYGYLNCSSGTRRVTRGLSSLLGNIKEELEIQEPLDCTDEQYSQALAKFQAVYDLPHTGTLNTATKTVMGFSRCGNKDEDKDEDNEGFKRVAPRSSNAASRHVIRRRAVEYVERDRRAALRAEREERGRLSRMLLPIESGIGNAVEADPKQRSRRDMYHDIKGRIQRDQWSSFLRRETEKQRRKREDAEQSAKRRWRRYVRSDNDSSLTDRDDSREHMTPMEENRWTWRLLEDGVSGKIPVNNQRSILALAYRIWSEIIPCNFQEKNDGAVTQVDITMGFGKHIHLDCSKPFDGPGGVIAHSQLSDSSSTSGQQIHIDEDECYRGFASMTDRGDLDEGCIYLLLVALHEIGHILGLPHSSHTDSIMYPVMAGRTNAIELSRADRQSAQSIWGVCTGRFDAVFDWVRKSITVKYTDEGYPYQSYSYYYNTYFYRDSTYWMYENRAARPRYGDPLYIPSEWKGIPSFIDAAAQVLFRLNETPCEGCPPNYDIHTYFFKDDMYYEYASNDDKVMPGFPRRIADDFCPDNTSEECVPDNLDTVHFERADEKLMFFKNEYVWILDPVEYLVHQQKDPLQRLQFDELFVTPPGANFNRTLTGNIDAIYYSNSYRATFVFFGDTVYTARYNQNIRRYTLIDEVPWNERWHDICDVIE